MIPQYQARWHRPYRTPEPDVSIAVHHGPRLYPACSQVPIVIAHGYQGSSFDAYASPTDENQQVWRISRRAGYRQRIAYNPDTGGATFGNAGVVELGGKIDQAIQWGADNYGTRKDQVALVGVSMGAVAVLGWAWRNPTRVAAVATVIGLLGVASLHDRNVLGLAGPIEEAYGGAAEYEANVPLFDPLQNLPALAPIGERIKVYFSPTDVITPADEVGEFKAGTGCLTEMIGQQGHTLTQFAPESVTDWIIGRASGLDQAA